MASRKSGFESYSGLSFTTLQTAKITNIKTGKCCWPTPLKEICGRYQKSLTGREGVWTSCWRSEIEGNLPKGPPNKHVHPHTNKHSWPRQYSGYGFLATSKSTIIFIVQEQCSALVQALKQQPRVWFFASCFSLAIQKPSSTGEETSTSGSI